MRPFQAFQSNRAAIREVDRMTAPVRKNELLGLSFPYDWPNPAIGDEALILNVLERGIYEDICRVCAHFGLGAVVRLRSRLPAGIAASPSLVRMLDNIEKGFVRAQA
jgi:hypothetical protein